MKSEFMKHYLTILVLLCNVLMDGTPYPAAASHDDDQAKPMLDLLRDLESFTPVTPKGQGATNLARACQRLRINRCRAVNRLDQILEQIAADDDSYIENLPHIGRQGSDVHTPEINRQLTPVTTTKKAYQPETDPQAGEPEDKDDSITPAPIVKITKKTKATPESSYPTPPIALQPGTPLPAVLREGDSHGNLATTRAPFFAFLVTEPPDHARMMNHTFYNPEAVYTTSFSFNHAGPVPGFRMILHVKKSTYYCKFKTESKFVLRLYETDAFEDVRDHLFEINLEETNFYNGADTQPLNSITRLKDNYRNEVFYPMQFEMKPIWIRWDGTWIVVGSQEEAFLHLYTTAPPRMGIKIGFYGCSAEGYPLASLTYYIDYIDEEVDENV